MGVTQLLIGFIAGFLLAILQASTRPCEAEPQQQTAARAPVSAGQCALECSGRGACVHHVSQLKPPVCACDIGYTGPACQVHAPASVRKETQFAISQMESTYQRAGWCNGKPCVSLSGPGSTMKDTLREREILPRLLQLLDAQLVFDGGCGDLHWLRHVPLGRGVRYVGCDVAASQVAILRSWFGSRPVALSGGKGIGQGEESKGVPVHRSELSFFQCDLGDLKLPFSADLAMFRDVLFHVPASELRHAIQGLGRANTTWLLTTMFFQSDNSHLCTYPGDFCALNLLKPPFSFPYPTLFIPSAVSDNEEERGKTMALWKVPDLLRTKFFTDLPGEELLKV